MTNFMISKNADIFIKFQQIDQKFIEHDNNFEKVFKALEKEELPKKGIFFNGQVFVSDLIKKGKRSIILVDNYVDYTTLLLFSNSEADVKIFTKNLTERLKLDIRKYNSQYKSVDIFEFKKSHDCFLIIDDEISPSSTSLFMNNNLIIIIHNKNTFFFNIT